MAHKELLDLESALQILEHPTATAELWAEAVKWLLINGPMEIRKLLLEASTTATTTHFPQLQPSHYTADGQPIYDSAALARALGTTEQEIQNSLAATHKDKPEIAFPAMNSGTVH